MKTLSAEQLNVVIGGRNPRVGGNADDNKELTAPNEDGTQPS